MRLSILYFLLALYVFGPAAEADLSFSLLGASGDTYKRFIQEFRDALTVGSSRVYGIPVLPATVSGSKRFLLIHLTNYKRESITVAIDVLNVYVVAYRTGSKSYFFKEAPQEAHNVLFKDTTHTTLSYNGNYDSLPNREGVDLGFSEFSSAIGNLFFYDKSVPKAFVVIIQTLSEAARYKYIEERVSINVYTKFRPDPKFLSLETSWSRLSEQIQIAQKYNGLFVRVIQIRDVDGSVLYVTNVNSTVVKHDIALLLNSKLAAEVSDDVLRMPVYKHSQ